MKKKSTNGRVVSYRFKSEEMMKLYDQGKISFEEATQRIHFLEPVTLGAVKTAAIKYKHFIYPDKFHYAATSFLIQDLTTGESQTRNYLYTSDLFSLVCDARWAVFVTNT